MSAEFRVGGGLLAQAGDDLLGFVGLVVPHIARGMGFRRHRAMFVASAFCGAALVVLLFRPQGLFGEKIIDRV